MSSIEETIEIDSLEIADLEYDMGGVSSIEAAAGRETNEMGIIYYVTPN